MSLPSPVIEILAIRQGAHPEMRYGILSRGEKKRYYPPAARYEGRINETCIIKWKCGDFGALSVFDEIPKF